MSGAQLPLDLGHHASLDAADFLVAPCNAEAHAWLERWPRWPGPALAVFGPAGCGKTHLAHLFAARASGLIIAARELTVAAVPELLGRAKSLAVEDCDGEGGLDETALFHLVNLTRESGGHLMLTGREAPARWPVVLPDLISRIRAMPALAIGAPDDAVLAAVLVKQFADRQIRVSDDVVTYLLGRMERSFAACARLVERLDRAALARRRPVTVPLAREVLEEEDD